MNITFQGNPVTIKHEAVKENETLKPFTAIRNDMSEWRSEDSTGTRIFLSVPSLDTGVCSMEVAKFINYAKELKDVTVCAISMDLPFALERWCQAKNNENVITLSDYKLHSFAAATATYVEELGLLTRAVFVVDTDNILRYVEYVREITDEPDYEAVLSCVKGI